MESVIAKMIKKQGKTKTDVSNALGISQTNFYGKLARNNFSQIELVEIADVLGMKLAFIPKDYVSPVCEVIDYDEDMKFKPKRNDKK